MSRFRSLHGWKVFAAAMLTATQFFLPTRSSGAEHSDLPNFDKRTSRSNFDVRKSQDRQKALAHLIELVPEVKVDFETVVGSPKWISSPEGFLSGPNGAGKGISPDAQRGIKPGDVHKPVKAFLNEHPSLFGHDSSALSQAPIRREFISAHNGLHTTVWQQELDGIPIFNAVLIGHTTADGRL